MTIRNTQTSMKVSDEEWNRIFKAKVEEQFLEEIRDEMKYKRAGCLFILIFTLIFCGLIAVAIL